MYVENKLQFFAEKESDREKLIFSIPQKKLSHGTLIGLFQRFNYP